MKRRAKMFDYGEKCRLILVDLLIGEKPGSRINGQSQILIKGKQRQLMFIEFWVEPVNY